MLGKEKDYLSILIGENAFRVVHLKGAATNLKVAGFAREGLDGTDPVVWGSRIRSAVQGLGARKPTTFCVIPSNIVTTKNIEIPSLDEEEIRSIIDLQAGRHTPFSREEILIGYVSIGIFQRNYTKVLLVIANRDVVKNRLEACASAGLCVEKVLFAPECTASFYAELLGIDVKNDPIGIIDISNTETDFIVEYNRTIAACRNIPIGIQHLLAEGQDGKKRLLDELVQSLEAYRNEDINKIPVKYFLTADISAASDLPALLKERLDADVTVFSYRQKVSVDEGSPSIQQYSSDDSFVPLVGAVYSRAEGFQIDLMPEEVKNQRSIEEQGRQVILSGIFAMIFLVLICGLFLMKLYFRNDYLQKLKQEYVIKQYLVVQLDRIAHRTRIIKDYLATRMVSLDVLTELYRLIPEEMYLQNVLMDEEGVINIQGISESMSTVFNVVKSLEDSDLFKSVKTRSTTAKKDRGKDAAAFDIVFKLTSAPDGPIGEETEAGTEAEKAAGTKAGTAEKKQGNEE